MEIVVRILTILGQAAVIIALFSAMEMILYGVVSVIVKEILKHCLLHGMMLKII